MLDVVSNGSGTIGINLNTSSTQDAKLYFRTNNSASARSQIYLNDSTQTLNFYTRNNDTIFWNGNGLAQTKTLTLFTDTTVKFESNVGVGISPNSTSRFIIQGIDSTSSYYALKVDNSASSPLLYVRNDGIVSIGKTLQIQRYNYSGTRAFWMEATNSTEDTEMNTLNANLVFKTKYSGGVNSESIRFTREGIIKVADTSYISIGAYNVTTDKYGYLSSASNTTSGVGLKFEVCQPANTTGFIAMQIENTGNVGIGTSPTARTHIQGVDTTSNYALKVDNSASSPLLYVKNDGFVSINQNSIGAAKLEITGGSYQGIYVQSSGQIALNSLDNTGFANKAETNSGTAYRANLSGISSIGLEINYTPSNLSLFKVTGNGNIFALPTYTDTLSTGTTSILGIDANGKLFNSGLNPNNINKVGFGEIAYGDYTTGTLTSSNIFTFTSSNVGIGITSPTAKLEIFDSTISIQKWSYNSINKGALFLTPNAVTSLGISSLFNDKLTFGRFNVSGASNGFGFVLESTSGDFTISPDYTGNIDFIYQRSSRNIGIRNTIPSAVLHISDRDISTNINLRLEPVNNVTQDTTGATINTTDNTTIILQNISVPTDVGYLIEVKINCRKTGGAGTGTTGDTNAYIRTFKVKNVSGTLTLGSISSTFTSEDISGNSVSFDVSGTNVRVLVTGTTNNNITWSCISTITR